MDKSNGPLVALCEAVGRMARDQHGVNLIWHLNGSEFEQDMVQDLLHDSGDGVYTMYTEPRIHLRLDFLGMPQRTSVVEAEAKDTTPTEVEQLRTEAVGQASILIAELEAALELSKLQVQTAKKELAEYKAADAQLIRRLEAKTKLKYGVDERQLLLDFLGWFMEKTGGKFDKASWLGLVAAAGVSSVSELTSDVVVSAFIEPTQKK